jgi:hypothetical protein
MQQTGAVADVMADTGESESTLQTWVRPGSFAGPLLARRSLGWSC